MRVGKAKEELVHRIRLNGAVEKETQQQWFERYLLLLSDYVLKSPVTLVTTGALTLGGLLNLGFFLRIGFMPDVDLPGSMALLFASALVGLGAFIALIVVTVLPGVSTRYLLDSAQIPLTWASASTTAAPAVLLVGSTAPSPVLLEPACRPSTGVLIATCAGIALIANFILLWRIQDPGKPHSCGVQFFSLMGSSFLWALSLLLVLGVALQMAIDSPHPTPLTVFVLCSWILLIGLINVGMARLPVRVSLIVGPFAGIFSVIVLAMLTSSFSTGSAATLKKLGMGEVPGTTLMLTSDMCQALNATPGTLRCEPMADKATTGVLKDVTMLSRIGSSVVVEGRAPKDDPTQVRPRLILRKDAVIAWTMPGTKGR